MIMFHQLRRIFCRGLIKNSVRYISVLNIPEGSTVRRLFISNSAAFQCLSRDHLKVNLYPADEDPVLESIFESSSMQQVFDTYNAIKPEDLLPKYSSQSLVTLWDLQKFMFHVGRYYNVHPSKEFLSQNHYIQVLRQHPTLQNIVQHVYTHCEELSDAALATSLLCMWRLKFEIRGETCQALIQELRKRKSSLELTALSRLCVVLKDESFYGYQVVAECSPLLYSYINNMKTDEDVRLVSIAIRAAFNVATRRALTDYVTNINDILNNGTIQLEPVTLMKVLMFLIERQITFQVPVGSSEEDLEVMGLISHLHSKVGNMLVPYVPLMGEVDLLNLSKFMEFQKEPARLIEALSDRVYRLVQEAGGNPSAELLACVHPTTTEQKLELANYLRNVPDCDSFARISHVAFRMLKRCMFDKDLLDKCWSFYQSIIERGFLYAVHVPADWDAQNDFDDGDDSSFTAYGYGPLKFVKYAIKYLNLRLRISRNYRHRGFEATAERFILQSLQNYEDGKCVITTQEYTRSVAFLVSIGHDRVHLKPLFMEKLRMPDLILLHRATILYPRRSWDVSVAVMEQSRRFLNYDLTGMECIGLAKVNMREQSLFDSNPMFFKCMEKLEEAPWCDSRTATDCLQIIVSSAYNSSKIFQRVRDYINEAEGDISLKCSTRFIKASFICATDYMDEIEHAKKVIERNALRTHPLSLIESMLGLCYHDSLNKDLVHKVFSVGFLDEVDKHVKSSYLGGVMPLKLRTLFMQLNRSVCLDMPEAGVPWFHEKYCQEIASVDGFRWSYTQKEVHEVLEEILGSSKVVSRVYSPYYYTIDCQILFDSNGKVLPSTATSRAATKLAVLVHQAKDYTCGDRRLKGPHKMKQRHLEILGYRVLDIDPLDWNSMRLSDRGAKNEFLQECIYNN